MKNNYLTTPTMKFLRYILTISFIISISNHIDACAYYVEERPQFMDIFRICSPELKKQWQDGCRFQDYEKEQNCVLWQRITSSTIPVNDIEKIVYSAKLSELNNLSSSSFAGNKFAQWLSKPGHKEDLNYLLIAKEIEEIRELMNDPWYYAYDGDEYYLRFKELVKQCKDYSGKRHASRYALQLARIYISTGDFNSCIELWENTVKKMPQDIVTDMIASYVGGAYYRNGNRDKAIELFTRAQDIGSLINIKAWNDSEEKSKYHDKRVKELEYIFNRFPNSPLLSIKLQKYVDYRASFQYCDEDNKIYTRIPKYSSNLDDSTKLFFDELKQFSLKVISSHKCQQKALWQYSLGYIYYLDGNMNKAVSYLCMAEHGNATPFVRESIRVFRFLIDAMNANNSKSYQARLFQELKWLDNQMETEAKSSSDLTVVNDYYWPVCYWHGVAIRVILGEVYPRITKAGNTTLALQLANYASNRIYQLYPQDKDGEGNFSFSNHFFDAIYNSSANAAEKYAQRIISPISNLDRFLNQRGCVDSDYIFEIVGTLYLREMNYEKAQKWLSKVSETYQEKTNIAKAGYFKLDPFQLQADKKHFINKSNDFKLRFAQEMVNLKNTIFSDAEPNRKANAKIRYAIGLRNSFGRCWYLTDYVHYGDSFDRDDFTKHDFTEHIRPYAQRAYKLVDRYMKEAFTEFTDKEQLAQAQLKMMNFATVMKLCPNSKAAEYIKTRCDNYYDYSLQNR